MRPTLLSLSLPAVPPCLRESAFSFFHRRGKQTRNRFKAATVWPVVVGWVAIARVVIYLTDGSPRCAPTIVAKIREDHQQVNSLVLQWWVRTAGKRDSMENLFRGCDPPYSHSLFPPCRLASVRVLFPSSTGAGSKPVIGSKQRPFGQRTSTCSRSSTGKGGSTTIPTPSPRPHESNSLGCHEAGFLMTRSPGWNDMVV